MVRSSEPAHEPHEGDPRPEGIAPGKARRVHAEEEGRHHPWAREAEALEKLYVDLGQWRQTIVDVEALEEEKENWKLDL